MIKDFEKKDAQQLIELWQACFGDEQEYIEDFFKNFYETMKICVAYEDKKIVSAVYCLPATVTCDSVSEKVWYLYAVSTLPGYRKKGYAGSLLEEIKNENDGTRALILTPSSEENSKFYKKLGFYDGLYFNEFVFDYSGKTGDSALYEKTDGDLLSIRENCLKDVPHISWGKEHLRFALDKNVLTVAVDEEVIGYLHYEIEDNEVLINELCAPHNCFEGVLNRACEMLGTKKLKVYSYYDEKCCKKHKSMIYCKFDRVKKDILRKTLYLGLNLE